MRRFLNLPYCDENPKFQMVDLYLPDEGDSFPVFVYFNGGGLIHASYHIDEEGFVKLLTENGIAVASVGYHIYPYSGNRPVSTLSQFMEDAVMGIQYLKTHIGEYCKMEALYIGGSSCGAYVSAMLAMDNSWLEKCGMTPMDVAGFVHDSAIYSAHFSSLRDRNLPYSRVITDDSAPLYYVGVEADYPPMLFITSEQDSPTRRSGAKLMVSALKYLGHKAPKIQLKILNGTHCAYHWEEDCEGNNIFGKTVCDFIRSHTAI